MQLNYFIKKKRIKTCSFFLYALQTMFDWNWLLVAGELGVSYGFYRWWKSNDTFLAVFEVEI
jgi:hypothetical protein